MAHEDSPAVALHGTMDDGQELVGFGNIRVLILQEPDGWFAQGLEVDYAAEGDSLEEVQRAFEQGFHATIDTHLRLYGGIERLLRPAPPEVWQELVTTRAQLKRYTQISLHRSLLPYEGFAFFTEQSTVAA